MALAAEQMERTAADAENPGGREHDLIVPRICIETFCVTPEFASAMQTWSIALVSMNATADPRS